MKYGQIVLIASIIIFLFTIGRFILSRILLLIELGICKQKGVIDEFHFSSPLSLFSGIKGEKSDLQLVIGNKVVIVKIIGGVRRKLKYEISDYQIWNVYHFLPFALPFLIDPSGIKKVYQCKFDLKKEKAEIQNEDKEVEMAYLFSPTPLSVKEISHKKEQELLGGDMCHGVRILTKKTLRNSYKNYK